MKGPFLLAPAPRCGAIPRERGRPLASARAGTAAWPLAAPRPLGGEGAWGNTSSPLGWALRGEASALILISRRCRLRPGRRQRFLRGLYSLFSERRVSISPVNCTRYSHLFQAVVIRLSEGQRAPRHMTYDPVTRVTAGKTPELLLLGCYKYLGVGLGWFGFFFYIFPSL